MEDITDNTPDLNSDQDNPIIEKLTYSVSAGTPLGYQTENNELINPNKPTEKKFNSFNSNEIKVIEGLNELHSSKDKKELRINPSYSLREIIEPNSNNSPISLNNANLGNTNGSIFKNNIIYIFHNENISMNNKNVNVSLSSNNSHSNKIANQNMSNSNNNQKLDIDISNSFLKLNDSIMKSNLYSNYIIIL